MADTEGDVQASFLRKYRNLFNKEDSPISPQLNTRQLESIPFEQKKKKTIKRRKGGKKNKTGGKKVVKRTKTSKKLSENVGGRRKGKKRSDFSNKRSIVAQILKLLVKL